MRTIERSSAFKRAKAAPRHAKNIDALLAAVLSALLADEPLALHHRDHELTGNWSGYRECHLKPDLLLIYRKPDSETLRLARIGSHSELFG